MIPVETGSQHPLSLSQLIAMSCKASTAKSRPAALAAIQQNTRYFGVGGMLDSQTTDSQAITQLVSPHDIKSSGPQAPCTDACTSDARVEGSRHRLHRRLSKFRQRRVDRRGITVKRKLDRLEQENIHLQTSLATLSARVQQLERRDLQRSKDSDSPRVSTKREPLPSISLNRASVTVKPGVSRPHRQPKDENKKFDDLLLSQTMYFP